MFRALATRIPKSICSIKTESPLQPIGCLRKISSDSESDERTVLENVDTFKCMNKVTLLGRATSQPSSHTLNNTELVFFTLATNEIRRNRNTNELIKRSEFHRVQVFIPRLANKAKQVIQKGSRVLVEGKINYNVKKGDSGNIHFTNIVAENIVFFTGTRARGEELDIEEEAVESKQ
ncbi:DNA replication factor A subunit Ssb1 [Tyrophagus putrescentiae]|nr:DNA replication factor A subunit Ssb1 [Tyrophagus putrescentiae]